MNIRFTNIFGAMRGVLIALCLLAGGTSARANTLNVPAQYPTLQAAVTAAVAGDTVLVANGTYTGAGNHDIDFGGKDLIVKSAGGASVCIIDCNYAGRCFYLRSGETAASRIEGFTIKNGDTFTYGYGANNYGGGIYIGSTGPIVANCVLNNNIAIAGGGGMYGGTAVNCKFYGNQAGSLFGGAGGGMVGGTAINCVFYSNYAIGGGGGMAGGTAVNCVFYSNRSESGGGGGMAGGTAVNCVFWSNTFEGRLANALSTAVFYSDVQGGYAGTGNINSDPLFVNAAGNDFHLTAASPCIDAGTATALPSGVTLSAPDLDSNFRLAGAAPDMGAYEFGSGVFTITPNPMNFGVARPGQSKDLTLNVFLGVGVTVTYLAIDGGATPGDFQIISQNCVGGTGNCSAVLRFTPAAAGAHSATLTLKGTLAGSAFTTTVLLTGSAAPLSAGLAGDALQFDGISSSVTIPHNNALNTYPLTVEAWINTTQTNSASAFVNKYVNSSGNGWQMYLSYGRLAAYYFKDTSNYVWDGDTYTFNGGNIADGKWHHVAFTVDAAGGKLYVDGALKNTLAWSGTPGPSGTTQNVTLGVFPGANYFAGQMDEVRIWSKARPQADIQRDMNASLQGNETGLLAYYRLDEGKGGVTTDATASHFDGAVSGAQWLASTAPVDTINVFAGQPRSFVLSGFDPAELPLTYQIATKPTQGTLSGTAPNLTYTSGANFIGNDALTYSVSAADGVSGPATVKIVSRAAPVLPPAASLAGADLQFDGQTSSVTVPSQPALNTYPLTVEAWINTTQTTGIGGLVARYQVGSLNGWQIFLSNGNLGAAYFRDSSNYIWDGDTHTFNGGNVADGQWHHVAFTVDSVSGKLYVDGTLKHSLAWHGIPGPCGTTQNLALGAYPGGVYYFTGQMDEVRIWNVARSPFDLAADRHASLQGNETGLLAYYRLDEGKGAAAQDATANHFDGLVSGTAWLASTAPVDTINILAGQPRSFVLSGFDSLGLPLTYQIATNPTRGTLSGTAPDLTYTPGANFAGSDALTYTVSAADGISLPATVKIMTRGLPDPAANLIAYEGFDYPSGSSLSGQNGGVGFAAGGAWTGGTTRTITESSLAANGLLTSGGSVLVSGSGASDRAFASPLGADGTTVYFSFLFRPGGTLPSKNSVGLGILGGTNIFVGKPAVGITSQYVIEQFGGGGQAASGVVVTPNQTVLLVVRADFKAGNDTLRLYVNPTPGNAEPAVANATLSAFDLGTVTGLEVNGGTPVPTMMDEYRVGRSFADVTPRYALVAVTGHVTLEGLVPSAPSQTLQFVSSAPGLPDTVISQSVGPDGAFSLQLPQSVGTLWIKGDKYLATRLPLDTTGGDVSGVTALLRAGDANNDNLVDITDFGVLVSAYNTDSRVPGSGYDARADFNGDGFVDVTDFGLLVGNYGTSGDQ